MKGYSETLDYLYGLEKFGTVLGLDNVRWILSLIGNPQDFFQDNPYSGHQRQRFGRLHGSHDPSGSRAIGPAPIPLLTSSRSPNGSPWTESRSPERRWRGSPGSSRPGSTLRTRIDPSRSSISTTALAFEYFKDQGVEVAVVEVGLGGRLDSTNVVQPLVSVITNIELDHQDYLGTTIEEIAREKAGIIKENVPVVTGATGAALTITRDAASHRADLYVLGEAFAFTKRASEPWCTGGSTHPSTGSRSVFQETISSSTRLSPSHLEVSCCSLRGFSIHEKTITQGLSTTQWPGGLELIPEAPGKPAILLDGAHNPDGARALAMFLRTRFPDRKKVLVFGVMKDKDFRGMLIELLPAVQSVILTKPEIARAALPDDVLAYAPGALVTHSVRDAIGAAFKAADEKDLVVIAGSFYTLGEAKRLLDEPT